MDNNVIPIRSATELAEKYRVQQLLLPGWDADEPFVCRMRRPSMYQMALQGMIPNPLLKTVQTMFSRVKKEIDEVPLAKQAEAMQLMAKYALVEPTYDELTAAGLTLTDDQLTNIYVFGMAGAAALEPFRELLRAGTEQPVEPVPDAAQPADGD